MTRALSYVPVIWLLTLVPNQDPQVPRFRSGVEVVTVDVFVRKDGQALQGLTRDDFEVRDDGVVQSLDAVALQSSPLDLSIVVDTSSSASDQLSRSQALVDQVPRSLRSDDRWRFVTFDSTIAQITDFVSAGSSVAHASLTPAGSTSLLDSLLWTLVSYPHDELRRHLVITLTDGEDTASVVDIQDLDVAARHFPAVVYIVLAPPQPSSLLPGPRFWIPYGPSDPSVVVKFAERTGGGGRRSAARQSSRLQQIANIISDFRAGYILSFRPTGPKANRWHGLTVKLLRTCRCDVSFRHGYYR